jgi:squalene cyclase
LNLSPLLNDPLYQKYNDLRVLFIGNGGMEKVNIFTKVMIAMTGQHKWPLFVSIPIEVILLPLSFPINFYQFLKRTG